MKQTLILENLDAMETLVDSTMVLLREREGEYLSLKKQMTSHLDEIFGKETAKIESLVSGISINTPASEFQKKLDELRRELKRHTLEYVRSDSSGTLKEPEKKETQDLKAKLFPTNWVPVLTGKVEVFGAIYYVIPTCKEDRYTLHVSFYFLGSVPKDGLVQFAVHLPKFFKVLRRYPYTFAAMSVDKESCVRLLAASAYVNQRNEIQVVVQRPITPKVAGSVAIDLSVQFQK